MLRFPVALSQVSTEENEVIHRGLRRASGGSPGPRLNNSGNRVRKQRFAGRDGMLQSLKSGLVACRPFRFCVTWVESAAKNGKIIYRRKQRPWKSLVLCVL